jgi:thiamine kinase
VCHGDFHPNNIFLTTTRAVVIDWMDASLGHPLADVARTKTILEGLTVVEPSSANTLNAFITIYLNHYFTVYPGSPSDLELWQPFVAAVRLSEGHHELQAWLLERVNKGLTHMF